MDNAQQLQKKLEKVFEQGALFTYELNPGSATEVASRAWAFRDFEDTVLVAIVFASNLRRWIHRIVDVKEDGSGLTLTTTRHRKVMLRPLNTKYAHPKVLERIKNEDRILEDIEQELEAFLEANPHMSLASF